MPIIIKNAEDIAKMRVAGRLASEVLDYITPFVKAGVTTGEWMGKILKSYLRNVDTKDARLKVKFSYPMLRPSLRSGLEGYQYYNVAFEGVLTRGDIGRIEEVFVSADCERCWQLPDSAKAARSQLRQRALVPLAVQSLPTVPRAMNCLSAT